MPLWGMNDGSDTTITATISAGATSVTMSGAADAVISPGDVLVADADDSASEEEHRRVATVSGTAVTVTEGFTNAHDAGTDCAVRNPPQYVSDSVVKAQEIIGAANTEATSTAGVVHAGWVQKIDRGATKVPRYRYETLVAASSITGDEETGGI